MQDNNSDDFVSWNEKAKEKLKQALLLASNKGTYQIYIGIFMSLVWLQIMFSAMIPSFVFMNPLFECNGQPSTEIEACQDLSKCVYLNDWTATYYSGLYCENQNLRSLIQSFYPIGTLLGNVGISSLSDILGRKKSLIVALVSGIIGTIFLLIGIYGTNFQCILLGSILSGVFGSGCVIISYVMAGQFCTQKQRQRIIMIYNAVWGFGQILFLPISVFMNEWYNFMVLLIFIPMCGIFLIALFFILEHPRFLLFNKKDLPAALKTLESVSMYSPSEKLQEAKEILRQIESQQKNMKDETQISSNTETPLKKIAKNCLTIKTIFILGLAQNGYNFFYYGVQASLERTGYSFGVSIALVGVHEFIGFMTASYFVSRIQRKKGLMLVNAVTALLGLSFLLPFVKDVFILQSIILSITRITCVYSYALAAMLLTQSFEISIQSTAMGLTTGFSQLGRFITPFLINKMNDLGIYPIIAVSIMFLLLSVFPLIFIKEPNKKIIQSTQSKKERNEGEQKLLN